MKRVDFIKTLGVLASSGMIISDFKSEKLVLPAKNTNADIGIGVERMRITSNGNHLFVSSSAKLVIY